jgi:uncharacterized membrane protein YecN with MAPEG domain
MEKRDVLIFTNRYDCKVKQAFRFESENDEISSINFQTSNNYHLGFIGFQLVLKSGKKTEWFGSQGEKEVTESFHVSGNYINYIKISIKFLFDNSEVLFNSSASFSVTVLAEETEIHLLPLIISIVGCVILLLF